MKIEKHELATLNRLLGLMTLSQKTVEIQVAEHTRNKARFEHYIIELLTQLELPLDSEINNDTGEVRVRIRAEENHQVASGEVNSLVAPAGDLQA